jgi:CRISPR-associated endonuclease Cas2
MPRPKKVVFNLKERLEKIKLAGLHKAVSEDPPENIETDFLPLPERIRRVLQLIQDPNKNKFDMVYLIMYDIENNKVRTLIAKYLLSKGCIRIQKSVYVARTHHQVFEEIRSTLKEIQEAYDNEDSIILTPVQTTSIQSMKIIGKNIELGSLIDPPNTLFY